MGRWIVVKTWIASFDVDDDVSILHANVTKLDRELISRKGHANEFDIASIEPIEQKVSTRTGTARRTPLSYNAENPAPSSME